VSILRYSFVPLVLIALAGCSSTPQSDLSLQSVDGKHTFAQTFSQAYINHNPDGDYDVVLVHDANAENVGDPAGALTPTTVTPLQIVHVRVYWKPLRGTNGDHPASTNAAVHWYVFGSRPNESADLLQYGGAGLVMVDEDSQTATVTIRSAYLKPVTRRGSMADPLGPSNLTGKIIAKVDNRRVDDLLTEVRTAMGEHGTGQAAAR
jgi:hypothetical protein